MNNLRSVVSSFAVDTLGYLYSHLQKGMDQELEATVKVLLQKAGQTNNFIRQAVDAALDCMVQHCTATRSIGALLSVGVRSALKFASEPKLFVCSSCCRIHDHERLHLSSLHFTVIPTLWWDSALPAIWWMWWRKWVRPAFSLAAKISQRGSYTRSPSLYKTSHPTPGMWWGFCFSTSHHSVRLF